MAGLDEFGLIRRYFTPSGSPPQVVLGVGDDCALLSVAPGHVLALSIDTQVEGVHFPPEAPPGQIARRVLHCAASDLAAMGAEPLGFTLALTLPAADENWLAPFASALLAAAEALHCPLLGGDTTRGPLTLTVQVHGQVPVGQALCRRGARVGDGVWVSGTLGDGAAALALWQGECPALQPAADYLSERFYAPAVDFGLGVALRPLAHCAIDISDGLLADLGHLCTASGVGAVLQAAALPLASAWRDRVDVAQARRWALAGGDDYRLCFTAPPGHAAALQALGGLTCIGEVVAGSGITVLAENGVPWAVDDTSYRHFR